MWTEIVGWETFGAAGRGGLFSLGGGFDSSTGRFTAQIESVHLVSAQLVVEHQAGGTFVMTVAINSNTESYIGMRMVSERPSSGTIGLSASGAVYLARGDYVSTWVRSDADVAGGYVVKSSSGFACCLLYTSPSPRDRG